MPIYEGGGWWWRGENIPWTAGSNNLRWRGYSTSTTTASATYLVVPWSNTIYTYTMSNATIAENRDYPWHPLGYVDAETAEFRHRDAERTLREAVVAQHTAEIRERQQARALARTSAERRADELLLSLLSAEQQEAYRRTGFFEVVGSHGGRYRIHRGSVGNVEWLTAAGETGGRLCAHPDMAGSWLPDCDVVLAQVLALTTDEAAFVRVANVHAGERPRVPRRRLRVA